MSNRYFPVVLGLTLVVSAAAQAQVSQQAMTEDKTHVSSWNDFADSCVALHKKQLADTKVREQTRVGGYVGRPEFFTEHTYYDADSGVMLSRLQWESAHSDRLHACEVYVHDEQGRVVRDYAVAYLPDSRNAPMQTLINLHHYSDGLHAFRQFDASGDRIYEYCEGDWNGKSVQLRLFEDDIYGNSPMMSSPEYAVCFQELPERPGEYLQPR